MKLSAQLRLVTVERFVRVLTIFLILSTLATYGQDNHPIKLGIGVIAIKDTYDESKVVTLYKDKGLEIKMEDFKLYGNLKSIRPYYFKPDYGLCYFICLEKTNDYFKILINDKEEGFLKNDTDTFFKTWKTLLMNATVERLDIKTNPLKNNPSNSAKTLTLQNKITVDRLHVIEVVEINGDHWINVIFSKSGKFPFDKGTPDCGEGWIKWKSGDKLLVNILLLC